MCECCESLNISEYDVKHFQCNMCKWVFLKKHYMKKESINSEKFSHWKIKQ